MTHPYWFFLGFLIRTGSALFVGLFVKGVTDNRALGFAAGIMVLAIAGIAGPRELRYGYPWEHDE